MSALAAQQSNSFSAHLALAAGVAVSITASTMHELAQVVGKLQGTEPANDKVIVKDAKAAGAAGAAKAEAGKDTPAPSPTPAPANAPAAASGSAGAETKGPNYDDVKARVLALAKISRDTASAALAAFNVDHANKLKLEDYPAFIEAADKTLAAGAA